MKTIRFEMRLDSDILKRLEAWRAEQPGLPSRAEAVRRLVDAGIVISEHQEVKFSDGEKLILFMLRDLFRKLGLEGDMDPEFVCDAISGGHHWALERRFPGLFDRRVDSDELVSEVTDVLNMWDQIERSYEDLSNKDKERVKSESFDRKPIFRGFYVNEEAEHYSVTRFLLHDLKTFRRFKDRDLDPHLPTIDAYRRMLAVFGPIQKKVGFNGLSASEIIYVLKERIHPDNRNY